MQDWNYVPVEVQIRGTCSLLMGKIQTGMEQLGERGQSNYHTTVKDRALQLFFIVKVAKYSLATDREWES